MSIQEELNRRFLEAMRARDASVTNVIRGIRTQVTSETKKPGFTGEVDDALHLEVIARYVKQLRKALPDFERAGEAGAATIAQYRFEIDYLEEFLPRKLGRDATLALVREAIAATGVATVAQLGRVMGMVMKEHRDEVDAALVRSLVEAELG